MDIPRPPTPQILHHSLPANPALPSTTPPQKYIILLLAPTSVSGTLPIALSLSQTLQCPLFQGYSLHESTDKVCGLKRGEEAEGKREERYRTIWLRKVVRTGLLFPGEGRAVYEAVRWKEREMGRDGGRRGSDSSVDSGIDVSSGGASVREYVHKPLAANFLTPEGDGKDDEKENPALMILTHPALEQWHRDAIRRAVGEYGIGVLFVPLSAEELEEDEEEDEEEELPVLQALDPSKFRSFEEMRSAVAGGGERELKKEKKAGKWKYGKGGKRGNLEEEMVLRVDVDGSVDEIIGELVEGVRGVMFA